MPDDEERIALFLDYENLAIGAREALGAELFDFRPIADALAERGRVVVRRAYADWSRFDDDRRSLTRHHVELIEMPQRMGMVRKNTADIKMAVDAIELCFERSYITTFVLGTGDSDFTPLVHKLRELNRRVIGIGIDYSEVDRPPELFAEAYRLAKNAGLKRTAHAGEFGCPWTNVRTAIEVLGVDRVDHGYTVLDNPDYARRCAESGIVFTVVPTNSYYLRTLPRERWALDHPIRHMPARGIRVHPNTDDPSFHNVTPTLAWQMMMRDFGFGLDDLRAFMLNGLDAAWIDDDTRRSWRREWGAEFDALRRNVQ